MKSVTFREQGIDPSYHDFKEIIGKNTLTYLSLQFSLKVRFLFLPRSLLTLSGVSLDNLLL